MNDIRTARRTFSKMSFLLMLYFVLIISSQFSTGVILEYTGLNYLSADPVIYSLINSIVPQYILGFFVICVFSREFPTQSLYTRKFTFGDFIKFFLICIPVMVVGSIIGTVISGVLSNGNAENSLDILESFPFYYKFIIAVIIGPITEEIIFRKIIISKTVMYGEKLSLIYSSLAFALFHFNLYQFFYALGVGFVLGYIYIRTGKIKNSIFIHCALNFYGGIFEPYVLSKITDINGGYSINGFASGIWGLLGITLIIGVLVLGIIIFFKRIKKAFFLPKIYELYGFEKIKAALLNAGSISCLLITSLLTFLTLFI